MIGIEIRILPDGLQFSGADIRGDGAITQIHFRAVVRAAVGDGIARSRRLNRLRRTPVRGVHHLLSSL